MLADTDATIPTLKISYNALTVTHPFCFDGRFFGLLDAGIKGEIIIAWSKRINGEIEWFFIEPDLLKSRKEVTVIIFCIRNGIIEKSK